MIPQNELGVIVLFAQQAAGFEIVEIQASFPDAIVEKDGQRYRAEFEHLASNFVQHRHDVRACDLVICWENNWPDCILPVLALSEEGWQNTPLDLPTETEREAAYWKQRALRAESQLAQAKRAAIEPATEISTEERRSLLLEAWRRGENPTQAAFAKRFGVTRQCIGNDIAVLCDRGLIKRNGSGVEILT